MASDTERLNVERMNIGKQVERKQTSNDLQGGKEKSESPLEKIYDDSSRKKVKFREWIEEVKHEVKVIHWTSKEELKVYTQIVVGATFMLGMGVYLVDLLIHGALNTLNFVIRAVFG